MKKVNQMACVSSHLWRCWHKFIPWYIVSKVQHTVYAVCVCFEGKKKKKKINYTLGEKIITIQSWFSTFQVIVIEPVEDKGCQEAHTVKMIMQALETYLRYDNQAQWTLSVVQIEISEQLSQSQRDFRFLKTFQPQISSIMTCTVQNVISFAAHSDLTSYLVRD